MTHAPRGSEAPSFDPGLDAGNAPDDRLCVVGDAAHAACVAEYLAGYTDANAERVSHLFRTKIDNAAVAEYVWMRGAFGPFGLAELAVALDMCTVGEICTVGR